MKKSERLVVWLNDNGVIQIEDAELYQYALQKLKVLVIPLVMAICFGIILNCELSSICVGITFMLIRKYSGGYHAPCVWLCTIESGIVMFSTFLILKFIVNNHVLIICTVISTLSLSIFSPIDSQNRRLNEKESIVYKEKTQKIVMCFFLMYMMFTYIGWEELAISLAVGLILAAKMQLPCILKFISMRGQ